MVAWQWDAAGMCVLQIPYGGLAAAGKDERYADHRYDSS